MSLLTLNVGLGKVRATILNANSASSVTAETTFTIDEPALEASEMPTERLWQAVASAARAAVRASGVSGKTGEDIEAVNLSCFDSGLVLLDKNDRPLRPIWTH